jgi:hypothetical protein
MKTQLFLALFTVGCFTAPTAFSQKINTGGGGNTQPPANNQPTNTNPANNQPTGNNTVNNILNTVTGNAGGSGLGAGLSNEQIVSGLKEALTISAQNSINITGKPDGFYKNPEIFIPFPKEAEAVKLLADKYGLKSQSDNFVMQLNRAAESAVKEATPIFINAITSINIQDGLQLLRGGDHAATTFLENKTRQPLYNAFAPKVKTALDKVQITKYWNPLWSNYNKYAPMANALGGALGQGNVLPKAVNPDLKDYVTNKALDGLFKIMAKEEAKIRKDPAAQVTNLLQTVFGGKKGN